ncbi:MAG: hypothetical protein EXX96DRAFT_586144 [Benjaminiella poitrasii]|nr:MAG: hypothetical protein EXX96DRAFT_586144 [Benjaminiella poitrasii]
MIYLKCYFLSFGLLFILALLPSTRTFPTTFHEDNTKKIYHVDLHHMSQSFSSHLLFDHLDGIFSFLSRHISHHFQDLVQVTIQPSSASSDSVLDIDLLKGQLQGAVGSFIEDSLSAIWNKHAAVLDKSVLSNYIERVTLDVCSTTTTTSTYLLNNTCIESHTQHILYLVENYIQDHIKHIIKLIVMEDLPPLFKTTQSHVNGILAHFNQHLVQHNQQFYSANNNSNNTLAALNPIIIHQDLDNSIELIQYLEMAISLYHQSSRSTSHQSKLKQFILLSKIEE